MTLEKKISKLFGLDDENWLKHSNPKSVWTRFPLLPMFVLSIWSKEWIGIWCLIPICLLILWTIINPKIFSKPKSTNNWASKCVLGEKIWANRKEITVPNRHNNMITILTLIQFIVLIILIIGFYQSNVWEVIEGTIFTYMGKMWFLDRMVWVFEDMKEHKEYSDLLY
jgi:hypothetical protein